MTTATTTQQQQQQQSLQQQHNTLLHANSPIQDIHRNQLTVAFRQQQFLLNNLLHQQQQYHQQQRQQQKPPPPPYPDERLNPFASSRNATYPNGTGWPPLPPANNGANSDWDLQAWGAQQVSQVGHLPFGKAGAATNSGGKGKSKGKGKGNSARLEIPTYR